MSDNNASGFDPAVALESCRINPLEEVERPQVAIQINSQNGSIPSFTLGNFSMVIGKAKSKKTFLIGVLAAAAIKGGEYINTVIGTLPNNQKKVLYFDTEQGRYHANKSIKRIASMAGITNPENLHAYGLRRFSPKQRLLMIEKALEEHSGEGLVFIDGGRDLLSFGVNDEREATTVTSDFLRWTEELNIHICVVLHQNKNNLFARGHFGTECINKAETTISVTEARSNPAISVVSCEYSRELKFNDFAFGISDDGIPVYADIPTNYNANNSGQSTGNSGAITSPDQIPEETHKEVIRRVFSRYHSLRYTEAWNAIDNEFDAFISRGISNNAAKIFLTYYHEVQAWIRKEERNYLQGDLE